MQLQLDNLQRHEEPRQKLRSLGAKKNRTWTKHTHDRVTFRFSVKISGGPESGFLVHHITGGDIAVEDPNPSDIQYVTIFLLHFLLPNIKANTGNAQTSCSKISEQNKFNQRYVQ